MIFPKPPFPKGFTVLITNIKGEGKGGDELLITLTPALTVFTPLNMTPRAFTLPNDRASPLRNDRGGLSYAFCAVRALAAATDRRPWQSLIAK